MKTSGSVAFLYVNFLLSLTNSMLTQQSCKAACRWRVFLAEVAVGKITDARLPHLANFHINPGVAFPLLPEHYMCIVEN